jgi:hypothetical protein
LAAVCALSQNPAAQQGLAWQQARERFATANPTLRAGQLRVEESRAAETIAFPRPNPNATLMAHQINPFPGGAPHSRFGNLLFVAGVSYLHARQAANQPNLAAGREVLP